MAVYIIKNAIVFKLSALAFNFGSINWFQRDVSFEAQFAMKNFFHVSPNFVIFGPFNAMYNFR